MLVATANLKADRIGAEFFSQSTKSAHALLAAVDPANSGSLMLQGGATARTHRNKTDGKVELLWSQACLPDPAFHPAQFLWLRIALNALAETLGDIAQRLAEGRQ